MKRLLATLGVVAIVAPVSSGVVACDSNHTVIKAATMDADGRYIKLSLNEVINYGNIEVKVDGGDVGYYYNQYTSMINLNREIENGQQVILYYAGAKQLTVDTSNLTIRNLSKLTNVDLNLPIGSVVGEEVQNAIYYNFYKSLKINFKNQFNIANAYYEMMNAKVGNFWYNGMPLSKTQILNVGDKITAQVGVFDSVQSYLNGITKYFTFTITDRKVQNLGDLNLNALFNDNKYSLNFKFKSNMNLEQNLQSLKVVFYDVISSTQYNNFYMPEVNWYGEVTPELYDLVNYSKINDMQELANAKEADLIFFSDNGAKTINSYSEYIPIAKGIS